MLTMLVSRVNISTPNPIPNIAHHFACEEGSGGVAETDFGLFMVGIRLN
jgi:hypothetical protein